MRITVVTVCVVLLAGANLAAQDTKVDPALIEALQKLESRVLQSDAPEAKLSSESLRQLREQANKKDVAEWRKIKNKDDWEKFRDVRVEALRRSLGEFPAVPKDVKVVKTKTIPGDGFTIENIIYETRPGLFVTANLYVPADKTKPMPGFLIIHAHHNPKTQGELQDMGMIWARQGCLVLVPDQLGHGERRQHTFKDAKSYPEEFATGRQDYHFRYNVALQLHLIGESLIGWMAWDAMRSIDVLCQQPGIDKSKIMVFGSVAGGGDPCAVVSAIDRRITAAAPFNFGGPQPETKFPLPDDAELGFNYVGGGGWESTRGLRIGGRDGFHPWIIVGALAPRGLIYAHEFAWDENRDPVWARYKKIWGEFYNAPDKLASTKGRGSVTGRPPEATHCNNIGPEHRKGMYPTLNKWFGLPVVENEFKNRIDAAELQCWTDETQQKMQPKMVHTLALEIAHQRLKQSADADLREGWLKVLGVPSTGKGSIRSGVSSFEAVGRDAPVAGKLGNGVVARLQIFRQESSPALAVPALTLAPANVKNPPVVIAIAQEGKAGFLKNRGEAIAQLLSRGIAVCLPDLRGTGETGTAGQGRDRMSGATSFSSGHLTFGRTVPGMQLQELMLLMKELPQQGLGSIALWGDSFASTNDPKMVFAVPHDAKIDQKKVPLQSEPMGGLLAQLGGLFGGDAVKAVYVRGGLVSFQSMLESPFCYFPHDAVVPGALTVSDLDGLAANAKAGIRLEALVDGLNRRVDQKTLTTAYSRAARPGVILREEASSPAEVAAWISTQVKK